jgi:hypothetical protein
LVVEHADIATSAPPTAARSVVARAPVTESRRS